MSSRVTWTLSAELMAKVLAEKGYHYQFLFARNAKHVDRPTVAQTLPAALEWLWTGLIPDDGNSACVVSELEW